MSLSIHTTGIHRTIFRFFDNLESRRQYLKGDENRSVQMFDVVTYTGPKMKTKQVLWPMHCVQGTEDAKLHKDLDVPSDTGKVVHVRKGLDPDIDSYSAFADNNGAKKTELDDKLKERSVTQVFVLGLATDYCVAATALDAFNLNYKTYLIQDASRGVAVESIRSKLNKLKQFGVGILNTDQVEALIRTVNDNQAEMPTEEEL